MKYGILMVMSLFLWQICFAQKWVPYRVGEKWGYSNADKEMMIEPQYEDAGFFYDSLAYVKLNGQYGYIDPCNEIVIDFQFDRAGNFTGGGKANVWKNDRHFSVDKYGNEGLGFGSCGGSSAKVYSFMNYRENGKIGMCLFDMEVQENGARKRTKIDTLPAIWEAFHDNNNWLAAVKKGNYWGIVNTKGELVVDYIYDTMRLSARGGNAKMFKVGKNGLYGMLDIDGKLLIALQYYDIDNYRVQSYFKVWIDEKTWGYINYKGEEYFE